MSTSDKVSGSKQRGGFEFPKQIGFLPALSPYDQVRTKWTRIALILLVLPAVVFVKLAKSWNSDELTDSAGAVRRLSSLGFSDRFRTNMVYKQMKRSNVDKLQVTMIEGFGKVSVEITADELCEKGYNKALADALISHYERIEKGASSAKD